MNTVSYTFLGKAITRRAPTVWNEVGKGQLLRWIAVLYAAADEEVKLAAAVPIFYGIKAAEWKAIALHQRMQIAPSLRNLFKENKLNRWLIPSFWLWFTKYYGPADKLSNLTAHEFFNICEPLYWQFKKNEDVDALNALCAVLYRPKRKGTIDDDIRAAVTDAGIGRRAKKFALLGINLKLAIAFNYEGCRNYIAATHAKAFEGSQGKSKKRGDVTLALAGGPLGTHPETKRSNLYTFLLHLVNLIEQEEELKRK